MEKLRRIMIGGKTYPIKMDLNVLEHIQENYDSINQFERDIIGIRFMKGEDGAYIKENDKYITEMVEPSIKAIKCVLPIMINEGLAIQAEQEGKSWDEVTEEMIFRECTISFEFLAKMIHEEFKRCFAIKK